MFAIIIQEKGGEQRRLMFDKPEVTIGRVQGNDIVLPKGNVSKRHARIVLKDGKFIIVDLKSTNGTYVNGRKITSPLVVKDSDKIYIGDFIMGVDESGSAGDAIAAEAAAPPPSSPGAPPAPRFDPGFAARDGAPGTERPAPAPPPHAQGASPELLRAALSRQDAPRPAPSPGPLAEPVARAAPEIAARPAPSPLAEPPRPAPSPGPLAEPVPRPGPSPLGDARATDAVPSMPGARDDAPRPGRAEPPPPSIPPRPAAVPTREGGPLLTAREPMAARDPVRAPDPLAPPAPAPIPPTTRRPGGTLPPPSGAAAPGTIPPPITTPPAGPANVPIPAPPASGASGPTSLRQPPSDTAGPPLGARAPEYLDRVVARARPPRRVVTRPVPAARRRGLHLDPLDDKLVKLLDLQTQILERLRAKLDLDNIAVERLGDEDLWQKAERAIVDLVETLDSSGELPKTVEQDTLIKETLNEALGLGPLEDLLADENVDEIVVDRRDRVLVGKDGALRPSGKAFSSDDVLRRVVERLVAPTGHAIGDDAPVIDVRLRDGSRLTAAVPPVATAGACLVLRKPRGAWPSIGDLVKAGSLSAEMSSFLSTCVAARRNILVCGSVDAGKTRVMAALAAGAARGERTVAVEEVAELALARDEWIGLETRAANGRSPAVDLGQLVRTALRLRPDRLVVGDLRGAEAFELIAALGGAIDGALIGVSGEGAAAALEHVAVLARLAAPAGVAGSDEVVREMVAAAVDVVVQVGRFADGVVRVVAIDEVTGVTDAGFDTQSVFAWRGPGDAGGYGATGGIPRFWTELESRGLPAELGIFKT